MVTCSAAEPRQTPRPSGYCLRGMPELRPAGSTEGLRAVVNGDAGPAPSRAARPPLLLSYGRPVMAGLLLMLIIVGIGAAGPAAGSQGPWHDHALIIGISLEAALAAVQIGLAVRGRYSSPADPLPAILRRDLRRVTLAAMIAILVFAAASALDHSFGGARPHITQPQKGRNANPFAHRLTLAHGASEHLGYLLDAVLAIVLLTAVVICAILIARMRPRASHGIAGEAEDESASLRSAVESGRTALRAVDDARAALIACYLAMEGSLAKAGTARAAAETPDELLTRATATGLLRGPAAGDLTGLFYEARFSSHDLPGSVKAAAMAALDAISAELRKPAADSSQGTLADQPDRAATGAGQ
jgi:Domain of unknown function (DUF4129)